MRTKTFICSVFVLVYSLAFIVFGLLLCFTSRNESLIWYISNYPNKLFWIGIILVTCGLGVIISCFFLFKRCYYRITMGGIETTLDEKLVHKYIKQYWPQLLMHERINSCVEIIQNKIIIHVDFPYIPLDEQEDLLKKVEIDLRKIFASHLGYFRDFTLSINFKGT